MGLFSGSTKVTVNTSVSRVIADDALPNSIKTGAINALFGKGDISDYLIEELSGSVAVRAERMYRYAEQYYTHGMPSGEIYSSNTGKTELISVLEQKYTPGVVLEYVNLGPPNILHVAWTELERAYGYVYETNKLGLLSTEKNTSVYLKDIEIHIPSDLLETTEDGVFAQWGTSPAAGYTPVRSFANASLAHLVPHTPYVVAAAGGVIQAKVIYVWQVMEGTTLVTKEGYFFENLDGYNLEEDFIQAKYQLNDKTYFFIYELGLGTYPTLDTLLTQSTKTLGEFFPVSYFRYGKVAQNLDQTTDAYKTSKKMLKYLGLDFDSVSDSLAGNPDIADVQQAMLVMAVPANSQNQMDIRYLFDFFSALHESQTNSFKTEGALRLAQQLGTVETPSIAIVIQDRLFKMGLSSTGLLKRRVVGSLGVVGTHTSTVVITPVTEHFDDLEGTAYTRTTNLVQHKYRKQITNTQYEEVTVNNLRMVYHIWGSYTTTGDENDSILLIPLDRSITSEYTMMDRELLYSRSLHFVFNALVITKLKWYQTGFFQTLLKIVGVVITVLSLGADGGLGASLAAVVAGTMTVEAFAIAVAMNILSFLVVTAAVKLFVKAVGIEFAFIASLVAALMGAYQFLKETGTKGYLLAKDLLMLSSNLSSGIQAEVQDLLADVYREMSNFSSLADEQQKKLDEARDLLYSKNVFSPLILIGESPTDFYQRTVHSGNIGVLGVTAISSFVDVALTLPKINDTLGVANV